MTDTWSVFDVIGPVMVGPSSSHTAGACTLGYMARQIFGEQPERVRLQLHGSFGEVYVGHYTDKAIIGGLLEMLPSNDKIIKAEELAQEAGMDIIIEPVDLGSHFHPNTVKFILESKNKQQEITGASLGGGKVEITEIDKLETSLDGAYSSLLICYNNTQQFDLAQVLQLITQRGATIARTDTSRYKNRSLIAMEIREWFEPEIIPKTEEIQGVLWARFLNHISHYEY